MQAVNLTEKNVRALKEHMEAMAKENLDLRYNIFDRNKFTGKKDCLFKRFCLDKNK